LEERGAAAWYYCWIEYDDGNEGTEDEYNTEEIDGLSDVV
jgi:hypothetical protein